MAFRTADGYDNGATLVAMISTNYTGSGNPALATWTVLPATIATGQTSGYSDFMCSGYINLNAYSGTVYIAFKYVGADPSGTGSDDTTTYQIDDVTIFGYN